MLGDDVKAIYCEYSDDVYRYLLSLSRDQGAAEDLLQSTFLQVVKAVTMFRGECAVKTWVFAIARHEYFRWEKNSPPIFELGEEQISRENTEALCELRDETRRILDLIGEADEPYRSLMLLRIVNDLPFKEIGVILGRSETWARVSFMRAKIKLIKTLEGEQK